MADLEADFRDSLRAFRGAPSSSSAASSSAASLGGGSSLGTSQQDSPAAAMGAAALAATSAAMETARRMTWATLSSASETLGQAVPTRISDAVNDPIGAQTCGLSRVQRLAVFAVMVAAGAGSLLLALMTLPMLVLAPAKFALSYSVGSALLFCSFAFLAGPVTFARSLITPERLPFTAIYIGSLVATLYTSLVIQNYLLILLCIVAQMAALAWYLASYFPGGVSVLSYAASMCARGSRSLLPI